MNPPNLKFKHEKLLNFLKKLERVIVAFSGGIDSSLVGYLANQVLGQNALAVTSASKSLKRADLELTKQLALSWGMQHQIIETDELQNPNYTNNPENRCYFCKTTLYEFLKKIALTQGYIHIVNGTNCDDLGDYRPGLQAASEHQICSPLIECGFSKEEVRQLAKLLDLENADKPQSACLSSRIPYRSKVSVQKLEQIEQAENILMRLGFKQCRVRHHERIARIEVPKQDFAKMIELSDIILQRFQVCGYTYVALDLSGFCSGSLNQTLSSSVSQVL